MKTLLQKEAHIRGGPGRTPTCGSQIEHSRSSHNCKHSWLPSPVEASLLTESKAACVWATPQQVLFRKTRQSVKSCALLTFFGGFPSNEKGGKRPPCEMQTSFDSPTRKTQFVNQVLFATKKKR